MRRIRKAAEPANHERWLVSYADFITLLFAFFVVMFATSQADKGKARQVSESVKKAFQDNTTIGALLSSSPVDRDKRNSGSRKPDSVESAPVKLEDRRAVELLPSLELLSHELKDEIEAGKIQISMEARGLAISFKQAALFPSGGDDISPEALESIAIVARAVNKIPNPVRFEGHTDAVPIHTMRFRSNWDLSAARSIALLDLMTARFDVARERLSIGGYGDTAPIDSNDTEEGRAKNRRVDIVILSKTGILAEPKKI